MKQATNEQAKRYIKKATKWLDEAHAKSAFASCTHITRSAVAEFIANQDGLSLWPVVKQD